MTRNITLHPYPVNKVEVLSLLNVLQHIEAALYSLSRYRDLNVISILK